MTLKLHQVVWITRSDYWSNSKTVEMATVSKVGRKYVTFSNQMRAGIGCGHTEPDYRGISEDIYLSKEAFEQSQQKRSTWDTIRQFMDRNYQIPESLTLHNIETIARLLGCDEDKSK